MNRTLALILVVMTTAVSCHSSKPSQQNEITTEDVQTDEAPHIFGGTPVGDTEDLSQAVYQLKFQNGSDETICTASRISSRTLITAAHCAMSSFIQVLQQGQVIAEITEDQKLVHPQYQERKAEIIQKKLWTQGNEFDLALLYLPESFASQDNSSEPAKFDLPEREWTTQTANLSAAGFGWASYDPMTGKRTGNNDLKWVAMTSRPSGQKEILSFKQTEGKGICVGDSGGPAFAQTANGLQLYGVAISVQNPGNASICQGVSLFISVYQLGPWIQDHLR